MTIAAVSSILVAMMLLTGAIAEARRPAKVTSIGYLVGSALSANVARIEAFRQGLRELGYVEGNNSTIQWQSADGELDRLPALAADLVRLKVDVIVTGGGAATRAAKGATSTVPIVMTYDPDLLATASLLAFRTLAGTSLDCPTLPRS